MTDYEISQKAALSRLNFMIHRGDWEIVKSDEPGTICVKIDEFRYLIDPFNFTLEGLLELFYRKGKHDLAKELKNGKA